MLFFGVDLHYNEGSYANLDNLYLYSVTLLFATRVNNISQVPTTPVTLRTIPNKQLHYPQ